MRSRAPTPRGADPFPHPPMQLLSFHSQASHLIGSVLNGWSDDDVDACVHPRVGDECRAYSALGAAGGLLGARAWNWALWLRKHPDPLNLQRRSLDQCRKRLRGDRPSVMDFHAGGLRCLGVRSGPRNQSETVPKQIRHFSDTMSEWREMPGRGTPERRRPMQRPTAIESGTAGSQVKLLGFLESRPGQSATVAEIALFLGFRWPGAVVRLIKPLMAVGKVWYECPCKPQSWAGVTVKLEPLNRHFSDTNPT